MRGTLERCCSQGGQYNGIRIFSNENGPWRPALSRPTAITAIASVVKRKSAAIFWQSNRFFLSLLFFFIFIFRYTYRKEKDVNFKGQPIHKEPSKHFPVHFLYIDVRNRQWLVNKKNSSSIDDNLGSATNNKKNIEKKDLTFWNLSAPLNMLDANVMAGP